MQRRHHSIASGNVRTFTRRFQVESLETRLLLCGDLELGLSPAILPQGLASDASLAKPTENTSLAASYPSAGLPALSSLPGAAASLFLDFDGHTEAQWGAFNNISIPPFDQDGNPGSFSSSELAAIHQIWEYVAEDYAPFQINVTTVQPTSFADKVALRVAIGGDGAWTGFVAGGISYIDSFTNSIANTAFVFPKNLSNGLPRYVGDAVSHEAGHAFGLDHQSLYNKDTLVSEYYAGPGDGRAPLMGDSFSATRSLWWYGTSDISATTYQDDMAKIARTTNGFGYRVDDHGNSASTATPLTVSGTQISGSGVISTTSDVDYFSFSTDTGQVSLSVTVPANVNNLDVRLELRDAAGTLIATAAPSTSFSATITSTLAAGSYRLVVASQGSYGDVGKYTVSGTLGSSTSAIEAPTNLTATAISTSQINLAWTDNSTNETGYTVQRSTNGVKWQTIATLPAGSTSFANTGLVAGGTYYYRVRAYNSGATSAFSNIAITPTLPPAPSGLTATAAASNRIDLSWKDVAGETGYKVERSVDGLSWFVVGTTGGNVISYQDSSVSAGTTYFYRVRAVNSSGNSAASNVASATTSAASPLPTAPSNLVATGVSSTQVNLTWRDNASNELGFYIERSSDGGKTWTQIAHVGADVTAFADTTVSRRKTYVYRLRAYNSAGTSAYSNTAKVTTPGSLAAGPAFQQSLVDVLFAAQPREDA